MGAQLVRVVVQELDRSQTGRAATKLLDGISHKYFRQATELVEEERELVTKRLRDGRSSEQDIERLQAIEAERAKLRKDMGEANAIKAAEELRKAQEQVICAPVTADETSASVGVLSSKACPECGGTMRIRQGDFSTNKQTYKFFWQCTEPNQPLCATLKLDPEADQATVIRRPDADLDGSTADRRAAWENPALIAKTHGRLRASLGDDDEAMVCPQHLLPMKMMPIPRAGGLMLDSYAYVCLGVNPDGRACTHTVPIKSFPQVAAALRRKDGVGILDS